MNQRQHIKFGNQFCIRWRQRGVGRFCGNHRCGIRSVIAFLHQVAHQVRAHTADNAGQRDNGAAGVVRGGGGYRQQRTSEEKAIDRVNAGALQRTARVARQVGDPRAHLSAPGVEGE